MASPAWKLDRLESLVDGVFGFALTLLVLDLLAPGLSGREPGPIVSRSFSYFVSFGGVGLMWVAHHGISRYLTRVDRGFLLLHVAFLSVVALVPVSASLFGSDWTSFGNAVVFAAGAGAVWFGLLVLWLYAGLRGLLAAEVTRARIRGGALLFAAPIAVCLLAALVAFASPPASGAIMAVLILAYGVGGGSRRLWGSRS